jgi:mannose-6-phosphate isomerase-like protein (cupin superfamily)
VDSARGQYLLANRLWHTDGSFLERPIRLTALLARELPPRPPPTEFADMRAAWDALPRERQAELEGLRVVHSIVRSREQMGFTAEKFDAQTLKGHPAVEHPLVRTHPANGRKSLYLASHASPHRRMATRAGPRARGRADRVRDATSVRVLARLARARHGDVGRPLDHASRYALRRALPAQVAPGGRARGHNPSEFEIHRAAEPGAEETPCPRRTFRPPARSAPRKWRSRSSGSRISSRKSSYYSKDAGIPDEAYRMVSARTLYTLMAPSKKRGPMSARPGIVTGENLSVIIAECPPGDKPMLHAHFHTIEHFFCLTGRFLIRWGDHGEHETVLEPFDLIRVPRAVCRDFTNISDQTGVPARADHRLVRGRLQRHRVRARGERALQGALRRSRVSEARIDRVLVHEIARA